MGCRRTKFTFSQINIERQQLTRNAVKSRAALHRTVISDVQNLGTLVSFLFRIKSFLYIFGWVVHGRGNASCDGKMILLCLVGAMTTAATN